MWKQAVIGVGVFAVVGSMAVFAGAEEKKVLRMSTTTSTEASGLLDELLPKFTADTGIEVKVIAKGTGAALRDGRDGNVDIVFVHARAREEKFVAEGYGTKRWPVMHNDFIIVGPKNDPAGIKGMQNAAEALAKIAGHRSTFISRGDDSGTHTREQSLWKASGVKLDNRSLEFVKKGKKRHVDYQAPADSESWYRSIGQGMGKTLTYTEEKQAYTLTDRGTYVKYRYGKKPPLDLEVLTEGGSDLENPYGLIPVNPKKFPQARFAEATIFVDWITSAKGQGLIRNYTLEGVRLFFPDAIPDAE